MALLNSSVPTDQSATSTPSSPNSTSGTAPRVRPGQHRQWLTLAVHFPSRLQHRGGRAFWRQGRWEGPIYSTRKRTFFLCNVNVVLLFIYYYYLCLQHPVFLVVSHPSTYQAWPCLASEIRHRACSGWHGHRPWTVAPLGHEPRIFCM